MTPADVAAQYLSHIPLLSAAMSISSGPVLELGAGLGSTFLLHGACGSTERNLLTLESDDAWLGRFRNYGRPWHRIKHVDNYLNLPEYQEPWGLAFVDHGLYEQRGHSVTKLHHVPIVVVHDTCFPWLYDYIGPLAEYKYRWDWRVFGPMTTVISDHIDIREIFAGMGL